MDPRSRVLRALAHETPDRIPVDFGATTVSGIHISCVARLRDYYGLERKPVKAIDCGQMLGEVEDDLKTAMGIDVEGVFRRRNRFGFANDGWKPWRMYDGLEILVPGGFQRHRRRERRHAAAPGRRHVRPAERPHARGGYFFDAIIRQQPIDEDRLDPDDNLEEFGADFRTRNSLPSNRRCAGPPRPGAPSSRASAAPLSATSPTSRASACARPKGIRDVTEWYVSLRSRAVITSPRSSRGSAGSRLQNLGAHRAPRRRSRRRRHDLRHRLRDPDLVVLLGRHLPRTLAASLPGGQ